MAKDITLPNEYKGKRKIVENSATTNVGSCGDRMIDDVRDSSIITGYSCQYWKVCSFIIWTYGFIRSLPIAGVFRPILYGFDVGSDIWSGVKLYQGIPLNYSTHVCKTEEEYSHPTWGFLVITLAWSPGLPFFFAWLLGCIECIILATCTICGVKGYESVLKKRLKRTLLGCIILPLWPFTGFMLYVLIEHNMYYIFEFQYFF